MYKVFVKKPALKKIGKSPESVRLLFNELVEDLETVGPIQKEWPNYSKLGDNKFHCHLCYSWVACWSCESESIEIEVYYAGSREDAPY